MAAAPSCKPETVSVVSALSLWGSWYLDIPPHGSTGNRVLDLRLADAFRMLIFLGDLRSRQKWIEREIALIQEPDGIPDPYHAVLARWWLDLHAEQGRCPTCAGTGRIVLRNPDPMVTACPECRSRSRSEGKEFE